ncbi:hypothetical protein DdX_16280 [Ditylenchus destructor]|uniref:Uncharacterized protein n=1 Tax=Ditylenchus destructor TaxID=166010 RepID=A0AAD4R030_9BILA|nr:hypothetical protein DdX_16280 [Ditylenchus destructor]
MLLHLIFLGLIVGSFLNQISAEVKVIVDWKATGKTPKDLANKAQKCAEVAYNQYEAKNYDIPEYAELCENILKSFMNGNPQWSCVAGGDYNLRTSWTTNTYIRLSAPHPLFKGWSFAITLYQSPKL